MINSKTEKTILAYNRNAKKYDAKFADFAIYKERIIEFQKKYIPENARILDLGCGPGNNITTLASLDDSYVFTGIDLSSDLLEIAKRNHPTYSFINQDLCTLKVQEEYDTILASFCVVHLSHAETTNLIEYISKSLVEGGSLYISFMVGDSSGFESTSFSEDEIFFNYYQVDDIAKILGDYGIEEKEVCQQDYPEQDGSTTTDVFMYCVKR